MPDHTESAPTFSHNTTPVAFPRDAIVAIDMMALRLLLKDRLDLTEAGSLWFDMFGEPIRNSLPIQGLEECVIALIDRAQRLPGSYVKMLNSLQHSRPDLYNEIERLIHSDWQRASSLLAPSLSTLQPNAGGARDDPANITLVPKQVELYLAEMASRLKIDYNEIGFDPKEHAISLKGIMRPPASSEDEVDCLALKYSLSQI